MKRYNDPIDYLYDIYPERLHQCMIEITNACNFKCVHCYNYNDSGTAEFMSDEMLNNIIRQLVDLDVHFITFTGGEPFLHHRILPFLSKAVENKMFVKIMTNGSLLNQDCIDFLSEFPTQLSISLYGMSNETYRVVTGKRGMYDIVRSNINKLTECGVDIRLKYLVTKQSLGDMQQAKKYAEDMGLKMTFDYNITPRNNGDRICVSQCMLDDNELRTIIMDKADHLPYDGDIDTSAYACDAARNKLYISPNGIVYPCVQYREIIGDANERSLYDIWKSAQHIAGIRISDLECRECKYIRFCVPLCIGMNTVYGKSVYKCDEAKLRMAKIKTDLLAKHF